MSTFKKLRPPVSKLDDILLFVHGAYKTLFMVYGLVYNLTFDVHLVLFEK